MPCINSKKHLLFNYYVRNCFINLNKLDELDDKENDAMTEFCADY